MTDNELYSILMNDDEAVKCLENNNYKRLFKVILSKYDNVPLSQLVSLLMDADLEPFSDGEVFDGAFNGDETLTSFDFSNITSIGKLAFRNTGITSANLRNVKEIGSGAFLGSNLSEVYFGPGVKISSAAFARCKFTELYIPNGAEINEDAFSSCDKLETVVLDGSNIFIDFTSFDNCRHIDNVYVTSDRIDAAKALLNRTKASEVTVNVIPVSSVPYDEESTKQYLYGYIDVALDKIHVKEVRD